MMGMSTHVITIIPQDEKWQEMKNIWDACMVAGIEAPDQVQEFFGYDEPDRVGVIIEVQDRECVRDLSDDDSASFEVILDKLPKDVKTIRCIIVGRRRLKLWE